MLLLSGNINNTSLNNNNNKNKLSEVIYFHIALHHFATMENQLSCQYLYITAKTEDQK